jgi:hypothetical protein
MAVGSVAWMPKDAAFEVIELNSVDDVDGALDHIVARVAGSDIPYGVDVINGNGDALTIIVGYPGKTLLSYSAALHDPPYYASLGDKGADDPVPFLWTGTYSELPSKHLIAIEVGRAVVKEFLSTGKLSTCIEWEETR